MTEYKRTRLDQRLVQLGLVTTRSQAESYIKLGEVKVAGKIVTKPGFLVGDDTKIELTVREQYVSRAGLKLASVAKLLALDFNGATVLDVGSSTGGFTDYALRHGAKKVIAVEVGTDQLHPSLRGNPQIELHEKTDIRNVRSRHAELVSAPRDHSNGVLKRVQDDGEVEIEVPDIVVADVSFISLREILPSIANLSSERTQIVVMVKPQFEVYAERSRSTSNDPNPSTSSGFRSARIRSSRLKHKGVIKNDKMRRDILKDFETWAHQRFVIIDKADSEVSGAKGNKERFYLLKRVR